MTVSNSGTKAVGFVSRVFPPVFGECSVKMSPLQCVLCGTDLYGSHRCWRSNTVEPVHSVEEYAGKDVNSPELAVSHFPSGGN